jgi:hypothetical protein
MKTKLFVSSLMVAFVLLATTCKEQHCPGFPDELTDYFPYQMDQVLSFVNEKNSDTLKFRINSLYKSVESTLSGCGKCDCGCVYIFGIEPVGKDHNIYISGAGIEFSSQGVLMYCIIDSLDDSPHSDYFRQIVKTPDLFGHTVVMDQIMESTTRISRVTVERGKGITEFYDIINDCLWVAIANESLYSTSL